MNSGADPGGGAVDWVASHPSLYVEKQTEIRGSHKNLVKPTSLRPSYIAMFWDKRRTT